MTWRWQQWTKNKKRPAWQLDLFSLGIAMSFAQCKASSSTQNKLNMPLISISSLTPHPTDSYSLYLSVVKFIKTRSKRLLIDNSTKLDSTSKNNSHLWYSLGVMTIKLNNIQKHQYGHNVLKRSCVIIPLNRSWITQVPLRACYLYQYASVITYAYFYNIEHWLSESVFFLFTAAWNRLSWPLNAAFRIWTMRRRTIGKNRESKISFFIQVRHMPL